MYYNFVDNQNSWDYIYWLLKESCASTLALKLKVRTIGNIFSKFGSDLTCKLTNGKKKEKSISFIKAKDLVEGKVNDKKNPNPTLDLGKVWNAKFTNSNLFQDCIVCGSEEGVEMHHVKLINDLKSKNSKLDFYTRQMKAMNRKQVPLCKKHHIGLHNDS